MIGCAAVFPPVKGQHSPWIAWSCTGCLSPGVGAFTCLARDIVATYVRPMVRTHVRPRDVMGRRLAFNSLARHGRSPVIPRWARPSSFHVRLSLVVAPTGPHGAYNDNEATTVSTTRLSETPVFVTWRRRDAEMPHLGPWRCLWVVGTISTTSGRYESGTVDLQIATLGFTDQLPTVCCLLSSPGLATPISGSRARDSQITLDCFLSLSSPGPATQNYSFVFGDQPRHLLSPPTRIHKRSRLTTAPFTDKSSNQE